MNKEISQDDRSINIKCELGKPFEVNITIGSEVKKITSETVVAGDNFFCELSDGTLYTPERLEKFAHELAQIIGIKSHSPEETDSAD